MFKILENEEVIHCSSQKSHILRPMDVFNRRNEERKERDEE